MRTAEQLWELDVQLIEITIQDHQGFEALEATAERAAVLGTSVGAGSVLTTKALIDVVAAGASFAVSPGLSEDVVAEARARSIPYLPGIATPTELQRATTLGVDLVKVFPATQLGGPGYLRALAGPFPSTGFVATGGISTTNADEYLDAGALGVGFGSGLANHAGLGNLKAWLERRRSRAR